MKPRITCANVDGDFAAGPWLLDFGDGLTGECSRVDGVHYWSIYERGILIEHGEALGQRFAMLSLCCAASRRRPGPGIGLDEVSIQRAVRQAESDTGEAIKVIRTLLRERTGRSWSVRRGRGADYDTITIRSMPHRETGGSMPWADCIELAAVTDAKVVVPSAGVQVGKTVGCRAVIVRAIAGVHARESGAACG